MKIKRDVNNRVGIIGGSSVGAVLGLSPYKSEYEVFCEFTGKPLPPVSEETQKRFEMGHKLEGFIARLAEDEYNIKVSETPYAWVHNKHTWFICHPDRIVTEGVEGKSVALEIKSSSAFDSSRWGDEDTDAVPYDYLCQCYSYFLCGVCDEVWLIRFSNNKLTRYIIKRNEQQELKVLNLLVDWVRRVKHGYIPQPKTAEEAMRVFPDPTDDSIEATEAIIKIVDEWNAKKAEIKELEAAADLLKRDLIAFMGGKGKLMAGDKCLAKYTKVVTNRLNTKKLKAEKPEIYAEYVTVVESHRFV